MPFFADRWVASQRWFFRHFFYLLFLAVTASQWALLCWVWFYPWSGSLWVHLAGLTSLHAFNRWLVAGRHFLRSAQVRTRVLPRLYYAFAFSSFFCALYLLLVGLLWIVTRVLVRGSSSPELVDSLAPVFTQLANLGVGIIAAVFAYGYTIGQWRVKVRQVSLPVANLPPDLDGLRIVQISDVHIGLNLERIELARFVSRINETTPDLVCITGDIADSVESDLEDAMPVLAQIKARYGVVAILGNHDHYCGANRVVAALQRYTPFRVLRDQTTTFAIGESRLHVIGLDDRGVDWARGLRETPILTALAQELPAGEPVLLLSHRPDIFAQAAGMGVILTLSGHTHGGQIAIPWPGRRPINPSRVITPFDRGLFEEKGSYLYVNCGLGVTGQRVRIGTPREISVLELRAAG